MWEDVNEIGFSILPVSMKFDAISSNSLIESGGYFRFSLLERNTPSGPYRYIHSRGRETYGWNRLSVHSRAGRSEFKRELYYGCRYRVCEEGD
jgi:hypothetical protein